MTIAKPPWTKLGRRLESLCRKALFDFSLLEDKGPLSIALSGGKDSLTLLFLLKAILGHGFLDRKLIALHVSGAFSCGASIGESFLKPICQDLGVELITLKTDQSLDKLNCYSCSRKRRSLIFNAAKEHGSQTIAFGHTRDDLSETLLLNLLQKGEFAGMLPKTPMHRYGVTIIRPLIYVDEKEIIEFSKLHGFRRLTCQCPVGQTSRRKDVKNLIQDMAVHFPDSVKNLAQASLLYGSEKASRL
ncbi:MAG: tRNA 2-thiocytidine biosynthesis TtcA family protein [Simkaniaceae bacterium]